jgi:hypothetical protein
LHRGHRRSRGVWLALDSEAWRRGWSRAKKQVVIGEGALWIWNLAHQPFPGALEIVHLCHARQHRWELSAKLLPHDGRGRERWTARLLDSPRGRQDRSASERPAFPSPGEDLAHRLAKEADSFERNTAPMRYREFREQD